MLLINPNTRINNDIPNIGLAYIATYLNAKVIDLNTLPNPKNRFLNYPTDILGISVQSRTYEESLRINKLYKTKYPNAKINSVSGILDVQCCYPYLRFKEDIQIEQPFDDSLLFPNYELFDSFDLFKKNWQAGIWSYAIMTSQGCPYRCIYCWSKERPYRVRSAQHCYEEIKQAKERWQIKSFAILDDCFNIDKKRVIEFCDLVRPLELSWICANGLRADRFDEDMARAMREAGCNYISFGIESAIPEILEVIQKGETIEQIEEAIAIAKRYFFGINGFFIIGLPQSSYKKDLYSLKWAKIKGINAHFSYYIPYEALTQDAYLFYGKGAHPISKEYPKILQMIFYNLTRYMRPDRSEANSIQRNLNRFLIKLMQ